MSIDSDRNGLAPPVIGRDSALFLDADGTLLEIAETPTAVVCPVATQRLLQDLFAALDGAVAIVSGRPITDIDRIFGLPALPVAGLHGLEWRNATGVVDASRDLPPMTSLKDRIACFAGLRQGVTVEDKGGTIAVHFRQEPSAADEVQGFLAGLVTDRDDLELLSGKMVVELKPSGIDKGHAIERFMSAAPFADRRPVFAGDDVTDETGFAVVNRLGGLSIHVGDGAGTAARYRLEAVPALHRWLRDSLESLDPK